MTIDDTNQRTRPPVKGAPARPPGYQSVSSIPAKYETVLFDGPRERKGFGSETRRFGSDETDNPGPGTYVAKSSLRPSDHESLSRKGFGAMASQATRFRHRARRAGPGPGAYQTTDTAVPKYISDTNMTSSFHRKVKKVKDVSPVQDTCPGPGAYDPVETRTGKKLDYLAVPASHTSAFKAAGHKLILLGNPESPAPGTYKLPDSWGVGNMSGAAGGSGRSRYTSSFAGRSHTSLNSLSPVVFLDDPGPSGNKPDSGPGPGSYETQEYKSFKTSLAKAATKASPAFQTSGCLDRFGRSLTQAPAPMQSDGLVVGHDRVVHSPGNATTAAASPPHTAPAGAMSCTSRMSPPKGVSAPFKSRSPGHAEFDIKEVARAPGPAYYSPQPLSPKSYHLNARKNFVPAATS